jgi:methyl-accepting chemotaxis protein
VGLLLALAVAFGLLVPRAIFRQVGGEPSVVEGAVRRIADGDLAAGMGDLTTRRAEGIRAAMDDMVGRLRTVVGQVSASADQIKKQSHNVNGSATELSQASAEQAQATHEASASMHQIVQAIRGTAEHVTQTERLAGAAARDARTSGQAVTDTVGSMRAIADRVKVIGEFARKTRILSLNAAIEAARARTGGRGFSVVAAEVRALAERSEEAAGEIDQLVNASVEVAERARGLIDNLVPTIEKTSALIQQIGAASREQSDGTRQIQLALEQIETVARRDAEASFELLELANDLAAQSQLLDGAMSFFHLPPPARSVSRRPGSAAPVRSLTDGLELGRPSH